MRKKREVNMGTVRQYEDIASFGVVTKPGAKEQCEVFRSFFSFEKNIFSQLSWVSES